MRPLKRPMFKYGGDVKRQGIMHGMNGLRNGGVATTMADATMMAGGGRAEPQGINTVGSPLAPRDASGRQGYAFPLLAFAPAVAGTAARFLAPRAIMGAIRGFGRGLATKPNVYTKPNFFSKQGLRNIFPTGRYRQPATPKGYDAGFRKGQAPAPLTFKEIISSPVTLGRAARENPFTAFGIASSIPQAGFLAGKGVIGAVKSVPDVLKGYVDAVLPGEQFRKKPEVLKKTDTGERGSLLKTGSTTKKLTTAEKETKDKERLNKIYKLLGVDRATRNAAGKALIDVSRYIDEGGKDTVSKKNISSTINKAIGAFDKRLDKVDQLKEAAGLMMAKNYLEGGDRELDRRYKQSRIDLADKELNPDLSDLKAMYTKSGVTDATGAAATKKFGSSYGGPLMTTKDFNKQLKAFEGQQLEEKTILDIATNAVNNLEMAGEGAVVSDGYYKVGENIVLIEGGVAKSIVG